MEQIPALSKMPSEITSDEQFVAIPESFFTYIKDNDRMFRILILQSDKRVFNRRLIDAVLRKYHVESQSSNPRLAKYEYVFIVSGVIGLLGAWCVQRGNFRFLQSRTGHQDCHVGTCRAELLSL